MHTKTIKTLKSEQAPGCREQPIQMTLTGDFNGFYSFLLQLEKMPRITRINQMKLDRSGDQEGQIQAQMTLSIFFEPESPQNKVAVLGN
jgi:Tfp pilus assembly protein PilO